MNKLKMSKCVAYLLSDYLLINKAYAKELWSSFSLLEQLALVTKKQTNKHKEN